MIALDKNGAELREGFSVCHLDGSEGTFYGLDWRAGEGFIGRVQWVSEGFLAWEETTPGDALNSYVCPELEAA